jgi:hypothetical protein
MFCHGFMPGMDECDRVEAPRLGQSAGSRFKGLLLDVECPHTSARACQLGKQEGVMAVAAGGIDDMVSMFDEAADEKMRKRDRTAQQRYIVWWAVTHGARQ